MIQVKGCACVFAVFSSRRLLVRNRGLLVRNRGTALMLESGFHHHAGRDLQVQDEDGRWRKVSIYRHREVGNLVLFFGDAEYEGVWPNE